MRAGLIGVILFCYSIAALSALDTLPINYYPLYFYEFGLNRKDYVTLNFFELEHYTRIHQSKKQSRMIASITIDPRVQQGTTPEGTRYNISYEYNDSESEFESVVKPNSQDPNAPCDPAVDQCINNSATLEYEMDGQASSITSNSVSTKIQGATVTQVCDDYGYCESKPTTDLKKSLTGSRAAGEECIDAARALQNCYASIGSRLSSLNPVVTCKDGKPATDPSYLNQLSTIQSSCNGYVEACHTSCRDNSSSCDNKSYSQIHAAETALYNKISQQETRCVATVPKGQTDKIISDIQKTNAALDSTKPAEPTDVARNFSDSKTVSSTPPASRNYQPAPNYQQPKYNTPPSYPPPTQGNPRGIVAQPPPSAVPIYRPSFPSYPSYPSVPSQPINLPRPDIGNRNSFNGSDLKISFNSNATDSSSTSSNTQSQQQARNAGGGGLAQFGSQGGVGSSPSAQNKPSQFDTQRPQFSRENGASTYSIQVHSGFKSNFGRRVSFSSFSTPSIPFHQAIGFRGGLSVKTMQLKAATGKKRRLNLLQFLPMFRTPASEISETPPTQLAKCSHSRFSTAAKGVTRAFGPSNFDKIACRYQVHRAAQTLK